MGLVVSFVRPAVATQDGWSQQELAEFYRVEAALIRAGLQINTEQGLTDQTEPWFVFCHPNGDVIIHFARIDGIYLIDSGASDRPRRGPDLRTLVNQIAERYPNLLPVTRTSAGTRLVVHPAALLAAIIVAVAFSLSPEDAYAGETADDGSGDAPIDAGTASPEPQPEKAYLSPEQKGSGEIDRQDDHDKQVKALLLVAMIFAAQAFVDDRFDLGADLEQVLAERSLQISSNTTTGDWSLQSTTLASDGQPQRQSALFAVSLDPLGVGGGYGETFAPALGTAITLKRIDTEDALIEPEFRVLPHGHQAGPLDGEGMVLASIIGGGITDRASMSSPDPVREDISNVGTSIEDTADTDRYAALNNSVGNRENQLYDGSASQPVAPTLAYLSTTASVKLGFKQEQTERLYEQSKIVKDQDSVGRSSENTGSKWKDARPCRNGR